MKTTKSDMLDRAVNYLKRLNDMSFLMGGFYDVSHESFKRDYERTLKRPKTAT